MNIVHCLWFINAADLPQFRSALGTFSRAWRVCHWPFWFAIAWSSSWPSGPQLGLWHCQLIGIGYHSCSTAASLDCGFVGSAAVQVQVLGQGQLCPCSREMRLSCASCIRFRYRRLVLHFCEQERPVSSSLCSTRCRSIGFRNSLTWSRPFWRLICQCCWLRPRVLRWKWSPADLDQSYYYFIAFYAVLQLARCLHLKQPMISIASYFSCSELISHLSIHVFPGHRPIRQLLEYLMKAGWSVDFDWASLDFLRSFVAWTHGFCRRPREQNGSSPFHCSVCSSSVSTRRQGAVLCLGWM